jgi:medium-chain acyl-[acyl-carrier-protein] hydrolase
VVSAARAPHLEDPHPDLHELPDDQFLTAVGRLDGTPAAVFDDDELRQLVLPTLRADFTAVETYRPRTRPPLPCPIVAYAALDDGVVTPAEMERWSEHTSARFELRTVRGGHFFLQDDPGGLARRLATDLDAMVPRTS